MIKKEIGAADIHQLDDAIAWRHFWLTAWCLIPKSLLQDLLAGTRGCGGIL